MLSQSIKILRRPVLRSHVVFRLNKAGFAVSSRLNNQSEYLLKKDDSTSTTEVDQTNSASDDQTLEKAPTPWYLNPEETPKISSPLKDIKIPPLPENSPETLNHLIHYIAKELGIDNLMIFDMRKGLESDMAKDAEGAHEISDFMIIGTGKSPKHLQKASSKLNFYIKHNLHKLPLTEGILKSGELAKYHRRLQKKGKTAPNYSKNSYGADPNTWIMTDTKSDGIFVHMLTEERRLDLNLEYLWSKESEREKFSKQNMRSRASDDIFRGIRYFHTSSRCQSEFDVFDVSVSNYSNEMQKLLNTHLVDNQATPLSKISHHLDLMYSAGFVLDSQLLFQYINTVLQSDEFHKDCKNISEVFTLRNDFIFSLLEKYNIQLTDPEILELIPILVISGSQFHNESFLTIKSIMEDPELVLSSDPLKYSKQINDLYTLSNLLERDASILNRRNLKRKIDILLLTVFVNRQAWSNVHKILNDAINRNDKIVLKASLPLISSCTNLREKFSFLESYLPLIKELELSPELALFAQNIEDDIANSYKPYSNDLNN